MTSTIPKMPDSIRTLVLPSPFCLQQYHGFSHPTTSGKRQHRPKPLIKDRYIPSFDKERNTCHWVLVPFELGMFLILFFNCVFI